MFIHIGDDQVIRAEEIVAMIDQQYVHSSSINEEMIEHEEELQEDLSLDDDVTKSIIITTDSIYYSSLSILTLKKRSSMISTLDHLDDYSNGDSFDD
ncbi:protein of unknown function [Pelagirhabdus alkalitolerans]|uniref:DUF370 domain-containing protein n=1 Tax=Pelagirhabdus alkalitolerans TaxID=1612202 RepID=A0A1G6LBT5_9BACI|nr:extracellular matrix/biofilm biosynthesis regulator RemA family protein [Pelagirhabdus alkalitolerans]SDC40126.1 protein of unknown function [Pelagirhabdus alkalitolerans]